MKINDTVPSDDGIYSVVAENKAGSDQTKGRLDIEKDLNIDSKPIVNPDVFNYLNKPEHEPMKHQDLNLIPARITIPLSNIRLLEGKPCRLVCKIEGNPLPNVSCLCKRYISSLKKVIFEYLYLRFVGSRME